LRRDRVGGAPRRTGQSQLHHSWSWRRRQKSARVVDDGGWGRRLHRVRRGSDGFLGPARQLSSQEDNEGSRRGGNWPSLPGVRRHFREGPRKLAKDAILL